MAEGGKERVGQIGRVALTHIHYCVGDRELVGGCGTQRELSSAICDGLEGWDGGGVGGRP